MSERRHESPTSTAPAIEMSLEPSLAGLRRRDRISTRVLLALVPMFVALLATGLWHARLRFRDARAAVTARNAEVAADLAARLQIRASETRALLTGVAAAIADDPDDTARIQAVLVDVFDRLGQGYADLWMSDANGFLRASARNSPVHKLPINDRPYFQQAMSSRQFVISEPLLGRTSRRWIVIFAMPIVRDRVAPPIGVVSVSMYASSFAELLAVPLPEGSYVTLTDSSSRIVYRTLDPARYIGTTIADTDSLLRQVASGGVVSTDRLSVVDAVRRLSTHRRVDGTRWQLSVGVPTSIAMASVRAELLVESSLLAAAMLLAMSLAWFLSRRVSAPLEALTRAVRDRAAGGQPPSRSPSRGEVGILASAFDDLVEQVEARQQALAQTAQRYQQLFDATPLPILEWHLETRQLLDANAAALRFYGLERERLGETHVGTLLDVRELQAFPVDAGAAVDGTSRAFPSTMHRTLGGTVVEVESYATVVRSARGRVVLHAALDQSSRRDTERALEESREQLRQAQKLESLGAFAGGIAHDFNNHLAAILGFCELAEMRSGVPPRTLTDLHEISRAAGRASDLTRQLLVFAKRQPIALQPLPLGEIIHDLGTSIERLVGPTVRLHMKIPAALPPIRGDRGQLEQIVLNLVTNARDAMPGGGTLRMTLESDASTVRLTVQDTGVGMPADVLARVAEPFFTTKSRSTGSGLGLSIVYSIVQRMHGELHIDSVVNQGTTVTISLPIDESAAPVVAADGDESGAHLEPLRANVLLVDDDAAVRAMTQAMLERLECTVTAASSGTEAIDLAARMAGRFDLLLTDMVMPGMGGRELAAAVQSSYPAVRVAFMSGYTEDLQLRIGQESVADRFLPKPFSLHDLSARLRAVIDRAPDPDRQAA